jgi:hypothetical protein
LVIGTRVGVELHFSNPAPALGTGWKTCPTPGSIDWIPDYPTVWLPGDSPTVVEVSPSTVSAGDSDLKVTIHGAEFLPDARVSFGEGIIVHSTVRDGAGYVDGFEIVSCQSATTDSTAVRQRSLTTVGSGITSLGQALLQTVTLGTSDARLSVLVEGSRDVTVQLLSPTGTILGLGGSLLSGSGISGADAAINLPGVYTIQVIDNALTPQTVAISTWRTVKVD